MRPLPISADTAVKLSKALHVPLEQLMHMPQHILLQKLAELNKAQQNPSDTDKSPENTTE
ncbi:YycC family protein [Paenibacillus alvei]|uniref:YycC family protein n=1 Tax=Paenibacillus alvei TaxID=44250 RepID=A0AAP7A0C8_PAEAL|nr:MULTISPECIES: YycC family protein [Paenibacillus]EJW15021.1 hypothetical protein PAV_10c01390 [Paenibacillus alvei DSM 29]MBG9734718.1 hypothetical protein [Paenibacillus alvei]MBG9742971.1 hypothetical protein [Paenibacillus alvei]MCY7483441.1 YycC family protein [Paenibacillus alvei]MCY9541062.1 YycC family protein [Paenibacillus alvei]